MRIAVVTDSAACLPSDLVAKYGIEAAHGQDVSNNFSTGSGRLSIHV